MRMSRKHGQSTGFAEAADLLRLLAAECRRGLRGLDESQLVVLRLFPADGTAPVDAAAALWRFAQECDSVIAMDSSTAVLHMPCAGRAPARNCLKKAMALPDIADTPSAALLATLPPGLWESSSPGQVLDELSAQLAGVKPGARIRHIILCQSSAPDDSRVTAAERSFLLAPLP